MEFHRCRSGLLVGFRGREEGRQFVLPRLRAGGRSGFS